MSNTWVIFDSIIMLLWWKIVLSICAQFISEKNSERMTKAGLYIDRL